MKAKPCRKCGFPTPLLRDCGYSAFNVGTVTCGNPKCGHEIKVSPCGFQPDAELIAAWNKDKPTVEEQLVDARKEIRRLKKEVDRAKNTHLPRMRG